MSDLTPRRKTRIKTGFCIGRYNPKESEMSSEFEFRIYISHNLEIVYFCCQRSTTEQKVYTEQNPDDNICAPSRAIFVNLTQIYYRFTRGESNIPGFYNVCVCTAVHESSFFGTSLSLFFFMFLLFGILFCLRMQLNRKKKEKE